MGQNVNDNTKPSVEGGSQVKRTIPERKVLVIPGIQHYHSHRAEEGANSCIRLRAWTVWSAMSFCKEGLSSSVSNGHYSFGRVGRFSCASVRGLLAILLGKRQFRLSSLLLICPRESELPSWSEA